MKVSFDVKRKFVVNGKEYASVEEMPPELREAYEKAMRSGAGMRIGKPQVRMETKIVFNGKKYESLEAMPADVRRIYQSVMKSVETGQVSPEMLSAALGDDPSLTRENRVVHASVDLAKPIEPKSSFSPQWVIGGLVLLGIVFMLYYLIAK
jgi:hypothetical protein